MTHGLTQDKVVTMSMFGRLIEGRKKLRASCESGAEATARLLSPERLQLFKRRMDDVGAILDQELRALEKALYMVNDPQASRAAQELNLRGHELEEAYTMLEESAHQALKPFRESRDVEAERERIAKLQSVPLAVNKPSAGVDSMKANQVQQLLDLLHDHANKQSQKFNGMKHAIWGRTIRQNDGSVITTTRRGCVSKIVYPDGRSSRTFEYKDEILTAYTDVDGSHWALDPQANCWRQLNGRNGRPTGEKRLGQATVTSSGNFVWSALGRDTEITLVIDFTDGTRTKHLKGGEAIVEYFAPSN